MNLKCECGAPVRGSDVNIAAAIAKCNVCGAVFSIASGSSTGPRAIPDAFADPRVGASSERGYRDTARPGTAHWQYRWFRWIYVPMVLFFLFWDGICVTMVAGIVRASGPVGLFSLFVPHVWIGLFGTYYIIASLLNRTTVTLDGAAVRVTHRPVPWPGKLVPRADVAGFDVGTGMFFGTQPRGHRSSVRVVGHDRRARKLFGGLDEEEATYLCDELSRALR